jgi:hypothetical protein
MKEQNRAKRRVGNPVARASQKASRVTVKLEARYGSPNHNNKQDPLDELIFIILSQMTVRASYERTYDNLKAAAPD